MLDKVFATLGGFIGNMFGGGVVSTALRFAGRKLGVYLTQKAYEPDEYYYYKPHLDDLSVTSNTKGEYIPLVFGKARVKGQLIWALNLHEEAVTDTDVKHFRESGFAKSIKHNTQYFYYADFALGLCEGPVHDFQRVWINRLEADISQYKFRFYKGDETQLPDPLIEAAHGAAKTPAFRGLSYIVFEKFPLAEFGNRIPIFNFEIRRKAYHTSSLENIIQSMIITPGCGEFIYDTIIQDKITYSLPGNVELHREPINCHNSARLADSIASLNDLMETCDNLKWVAPVVCWFADNLDAGIADVFPAVEYNDSSSRLPWNVAGLARENARVISKENSLTPNYGGTPDDASLVRYLELLKSRGLKIMLYPMLLLDVPGKPWRGHMSSSSEGIKRFFNHPQGYKNFILHYARLARGKVDAFVIGSELKSITKIPAAIHELTCLAREVNAILGSSVIVTYAADWSEYHHTDGGWYNLDELWSCDAIDVVGIDAYFPLTNSASSNISEDSIKNGWKSGEGFDDSAPEWAWKNIEYWWKNYHINADGSRSAWRPRCKKIWFTEFGFPSIDKAPNKPNIFYDPNCLDGGVPKYSNSAVDFAIQRKAIKATLEYWRGSEFVENMFLWTWDARPFPAFPHSKAWRDSNCWLRGHWVSGKLSFCNLGSIILALCERAGIDAGNVKISDLDEAVHGLVFKEQSSIWDIMALLRLAYLFDVTHNYRKLIEFTKRGSRISKELDSGELVKQKDIINITKISKDNIISEITFGFLDLANSYRNNIVRFFSNQVTNTQIYELNLPISMDENSAQILCAMILGSALEESKRFKITIMITHLLEIASGDVVVLYVFDKSYSIRITDVSYHKLLCSIEGVGF